MTSPAPTAVIVFGAGGHGRVVADVALQAGMHLAGFVDDNPATRRSAHLPAPVLGDREWLQSARREGWSVALGVGDNYARRTIAQFLSVEGFDLVTLISPSATISPSARIGIGTVVMPGAVINSMAVIGDGVIVNSGAVVEHDVCVGDFAHLSPHAALGGGAEVGELAHVAIGATVLPLIRIGARSILGAGSVAPNHIPNDVVAFGVPARIRRDIALKLEQEA